jgi:hypothetical protein
MDMSNISARALVLAGIGASVFASGGTLAQAPAALEQRVAALKQALQENQAQLRSAR